MTTFSEREALARRRKTLVRQNATEEIDYVCDNNKLYNKPSKRGKTYIIIKTIPHLSFLGFRK